MSGEKWLYNRLFSSFVLTLGEATTQVKRSLSIKRKGAVWVCVGFLHATPLESNSSEIVRRKCRDYENGYHITVKWPRNFIIRHPNSPACGLVDISVLIFRN
jgi:hypothetical protein